MKMKSFFASDMNKAMSLARSELGSEAMLVDTRPSSLECRHLGECEVVMSVGEDRCRAEPRRVSGSRHELSAEMALLQRKLERVLPRLPKRV